MLEPPVAICNRGVVMRPFRSTPSRPSRLLVLNQAASWGEIREASISLLSSHHLVSLLTLRPEGGFSRGAALFASVSGGMTSYGGGISGGSSGGGSGGGGGGGDGWHGHGGMHSPNVLAELALNEAAAETMVEEVIILDVSGEIFGHHCTGFKCPLQSDRGNHAHNLPVYAGMKCGGCVGHVKKILESQPGVKQVRNIRFPASDML